MDKRVENYLLNTPFSCESTIGVSQQNVVEQKGGCAFDTLYQTLHKLGVSFDAIPESYEQKSQYGCPQINSDTLWPSGNRCEAVFQYIGSQESFI